MLIVAFSNNSCKTKKLKNCIIFHNLLYTVTKLYKIFNKPNVLCNFGSPVQYLGVRNFCWTKTSKIPEWNTVSSATQFVSHTVKIYFFLSYYFFYHKIKL